MRHFNRYWEELASETNIVLLLAVLGRWFQSLATPCVLLDTLVPDEHATGVTRTKPQPVRKYNIMPFQCRFIVSKVDNLIRE
jgi:hypothetical protein